MSEIKLLPCPFCGGEVELNSVGVSTTYYFISCEECGHRQVGSIHKEALVNSWNTRKPMERILTRSEEELKWTRAEQSIECERCNGYGSPLQSKNSGKIEALKKAIEIVKEEGGIE